MTSRGLNSALLVLGPLLVAGLDWPMWGAAIWVVGLLFWRWASIITNLGPQQKAQPLVLETISASHFVEKVRWSLDWLALPYQEVATGGTLGAIFLGRTVPRLKFRTGIVVSQIGNSAEILRYLWGRYSVEKGSAAEFLRPTEEALALEAMLDRYGADLQVWVYGHLLHSRDLTLHVWGANDPELPAWQRWALRLLFPVNRWLIRRSFRITPENFERSVQRIQSLLADVEARLQGQHHLLGGAAPHFVDITFASLSALWQQPAGFAAGRARGVQLAPAQVPAEMNLQVQGWRDAYPACNRLIDRMYAQRMQRGGTVVQAAA